METAEQLERRYSRTQRLVSFSTAAAIACGALWLTLRLGLGRWILNADEDGQRRFDDPETVYGLLFLGGELGCIAFAVLVAGLRWKLWRLGDAIARAHTLERRIDAQNYERVRVLGE